MLGSLLLPAETSRANGSLSFDDGATNNFPLGPPQAIGNSRFGRRNGDITLAIPATRGMMGVRYERAFPDSGTGVSGASSWEGLPLHAQSVF